MTGKEIAACIQREIDRTGKTPEEILLENGAKKMGPHRFRCFNPVFNALVNDGRFVVYRAAQPGIAQAGKVFPELRERDLAAQLLIGCGLAEPENPASWVAKEIGSDRYFDLPHTNRARVLEIALCNLGRVNVLELCCANDAQIYDAVKTPEELRMERTVSHV